MKKRLLSVLCILCMVLALFTVSAFAEDAEESTLQALINAAEDGALIGLGEVDVTESITIPAGKRITFDLHGCKLTNAAGNDTITVELGATLEIIDSIGGGVVDNVTHQRAALWNNGTVTLNGGTFTRSLENGSSSTNSGGNSYYAIVNHGNMTINDGVTVLQDGQYSSLLENGYYNYTGSSARQKYDANVAMAEPSLVINGGLFTGGLNTIKNDDGAYLTINDGTFINVAQAAVMNYNVAVIYGGTFETAGAGNTALVNTQIDNSLDKGSLTIYGGTFTCSGDLVTIGQGYSNAGTIDISGGEFTYNGNFYNAAVLTQNTTITGGTFVDNQGTAQDVSDYIAPGLEQNEDGEVVIASDAEARIGTMGYPTLADALNAAQSGDTIVLLADVNTGAIVVPGGVTLDGNGHTITCNEKLNNGAFITVVSNNVTIQNITIDTNGNAKHGVQFYCMNNGVLENAVVNGGYYTSVIVNGATGVTIKNVVLNPETGAYANIEYAMGSNVTTIPSLTVSNVTGNRKLPLVYVDGDTIDRVIANSSAKNADEAVSVINKNLTGVSLVLDKDGNAVADETDVGLLWAGLLGNGGAAFDVSRLPFTDVTTSDWFAYSVAYVYGYGIMEGTGDYKFSPYGSVSRAQVAQIVYNMEGQPRVSGSAFDDVASTAWYADAVNWAASENIVNGYGSGKFGPEDPVTREQLAAILYRYAQYKGLDVSARGELGFEDSGEISSYAVSAVKWAVGVGILSGKGSGILDPTGTAVRAEAAKMLQSFCMWYN